MYDPEDIDLPENYLPEHPFDAGVHQIRDERLLKRPLTESVIRGQLAKYYALVTHTDAQIGRILEALDASGQAENTIVVFSSDNGLALGSHGLTGKQNVYEHSVRVPLVISGPGIPEGQTRAQLCYLYDVYPTLCELAGVEIPETVEFSSLKQLFDEPDRPHRDHLYFSFMSWQRAVRGERYKLIEYAVDGARHTQLFDLKNDPEEVRDLFREDSNEPEIQRLRRRLEAERDRLNDGESESPHLREMSEAFWRSYGDGASSSKPGA